MSFRKRNLGISSGASGASQLSSRTASSPELTSGVRPSPDDGRSTTSTGTPSLDNLLAGHAGLPLGKILLIEENFTTDFAGTLLKYYAAEGVVQGHKVHVIGVGELWGRSLPGLLEQADSAADKSGAGVRGKMKIAWRYERLGEFGAGIAGPRGAPSSYSEMRDTNPAPVGDDQVPKQEAFCHAFDLTKRLTHPSLSSMEFIPITPSTESPFFSIRKRLWSAVASSPQTMLHRIIVPSLLSPAIYPPTASQPEHLLQFLHSFRGLLNEYPSRTTAMISLPLFLYPRSSGLVRWIELLSDGVIELCPFPHSRDTNPGAATVHEEPPQGILKIHRLPVLHERGGGNDQNIEEDWAFTLSRRKFEIKPFSLPPVESDKEMQQASIASEMPRKTELEF